MDSFSNAYATTLDGAIDDSQTTLDVISVTGKPPSVPFRMRIKAEGVNTDEIITATGVAGNTLTVIRASEAYNGVQTASAHGNNAVIEHVLTANSLTDLITMTAKGTWFGLTQETNTTITTNRAYYARITIPVIWEPNRLGLTINTSNGNLDLGIYEDDGTGQNPGDKIITLGSTASPGTGTRLFTIAPGVLLPGVYWLAFASSSGTISVGYVGTGTGNGAGGPIRCCIQDTAFPLPATAGAGLTSFSWTIAVWAEIV